MHLRIRPTLVALALFAGSAHAAEALDDRLSRVEAGLDAELARAQALDQRLAAASGTLDASRAVLRYQDAVYQFLVGHHAAAAEDFFVLVASGVLDEAGLQREGQWYLGESLHALGHLEMAESVYRGIADERAHPFRADAVRRLLEIYSHDADPQRFERLFRLEIVQGGVEPTDLIIYSVGKALRVKGETARAKAYLGQITPESPFRLRALYQIGAMLVQQGDEPALRDAIRTFREIALAQPTTPSDRQVVDLSLLALGRIHDHLGEFGESVKAYEMIGESSVHRAEKLHELVWLYIGEGSSGLALDAAEQFLAGFPDHRNAAELRLVRAHLLFQRGEWERALETYEDVVAAYGPVRDRFGRLARPVGMGGRSYLEEVLRDLGPDPLGTPDEPTTSEDSSASEAPAVASLDTPSDPPAVPGAEPLPGYALAVMREDPAFVRALVVWDELGGTEDVLVEAEDLVGELEHALLGQGAGDLVDDARLDSLRGQVSALGLRLDLLDAESRWLREQGADAALAPLQSRREALAGELARLARQVDEVATAAEIASERVTDDHVARVADLSQQLGALPPGDPARPQVEAALATAKSEAAVPSSAVPGLDELAAESAQVFPRLAEGVQELALAHRALRSQVGVDVDIDPVSVRIDGLHATMSRTIDRLARTGDALAAVEASELRAVHDVFRREADAVSAARAELEAEQPDVEEVASGVVRGNFRRLAELFAERVLGAEMGAVNVHWSRWVQAGEERDTTADERSRAIAELEREYELLERKLEQ